MKWERESKIHINLLFKRTYKYEEEAQDEVANIADDAVESRESEGAGDTPWMTAQGIVVTQVLVTTDIQQLSIKECNDDVTMT